MRASKEPSSEDNNQKMNIKAVSGVMVTIMIFLGAIVIGGGTIAFQKGLFQSSQVEPEDVLEGLKEIASLEGTCPANTKVGSVRFKVFDGYTSAETQITAGNVFLIEAPNGAVSDNTTATSGFATIASVPCGLDKEYQLIMPNIAGTSGSAKSEVFTFNDVQKDIKLYTNQYAKVQVKVKDLTNGDDEFLFADNQLLVNSTSFTDMNDTNVFDDSDLTDFAVGLGGNINLEILLQGVTATQFGSDEGFQTTDSKAGTKTTLGQKTYACIADGTGDEWDPALWQFSVDGVSKPDVKTSIDDDSKENANVKDAEACYEINSLSDAVQTIHFKAVAKTDQNPDTTNDDLKICFLSEGLYQSSDNSDNFKTGIAQDNTAATAVTYTNEVPCIIIGIS